MKTKLIAKILAMLIMCSFVMPTPAQASIGTTILKKVVKKIVAKLKDAAIEYSDSHIETTYITTNTSISSETIAQKNPNSTVTGIYAKDTSSSTTVINSFVYAYATDGTAAAYVHIHTGAASTSTVSSFYANYLAAISYGGSSSDSATGIYTGSGTSFLNSVHSNYIDVYSEYGTACGTYAAGNFNEGSYKNTYYVQADAGSAYGIYVDNAKYSYMSQEYIEVHSSGTSTGIYMEGATSYTSGSNPYIEDCTITVTSDSTSSDDHVAGILIVDSKIDHISASGNAPYINSDDMVFATYEIKAGSTSTTYDYYSFPYLYSESSFDYWKDWYTGTTTARYSTNIKYGTSSLIDVSALTGSAIGIGLSSEIDTDDTNYDPSSVYIGYIDGLSINVSSTYGNAIGIYTEYDNQIGSLSNTSISISASGNVYGYMLSGSTTVTVNDDVNTGIALYNENKGTSEGTITSIDYDSVSLELLSTGVSGGGDSAYGIYLYDYTLSDFINFDSISVTAAGTPYGLYIYDSSINYYTYTNIDFSVYTYSSAAYGAWISKSSISSNISGSILLSVPDDYSQSAELSLTGFYLSDLYSSISISTNITIDSAATNITLINRDDSRHMVYYYGDAVIESITTADTSKITEGGDLYVYTLGADIKNSDSLLFYNRSTGDSSDIILGSDASVSIVDYSATTYGIVIDGDYEADASIDISGVDYAIMLSNKATLNLYSSIISANVSNSVENSTLSLADNSKLSGDLSLTGTSSLTLNDSTLSNSTVTISSGSTVTIESSNDNDLSSLISSSIILEGDASLVFTSYAGLYIDENSSIDLDFTIDLTDLTSVAHYVLFEIEGSATYEAVLSYLENNLDTILSYNESATSFDNPYYGDDLTGETLTWEISADAQSGTISLSNHSGDMYYFNWKTYDNGNTSLVAVDSSYAATADIVAYSSSNERVDSDSNGSNINHSFIGLNSTSYGGAIYNHSSYSIGNIIGDFLANYASGTYAEGGAIYNSYSIGNITGDFLANYVSGTYAKGGAIYNYDSSLGNIEGDFWGNYAYSDYEYAYGGAIYNYHKAKIGNITGYFSDNYAYSYSHSTSQTSLTTISQGGAIYNCDSSSIGNIEGYFNNNYAYAYTYEKNSTFYDSVYTTSTAEGGAIYNSSSTISSISGDFISNYAYAYAYSSSSKSATTTSTAEGGAIYNSSSSISSISGDFISNYAYAYAYSSSSSKSATTTSTAKGGAIYNYDSSLDYIEGNFIGNYAYAYSYAKGSSYNTTSSIATAEGGAVYNEASISNSELSFFALNGDMEFTGNYVETYLHGYYSTYTTTTTSNAIYNYAKLSSHKATINLNALDGNSLVINDGIDGGSTYVSNQLIEINNVSLDDYEGVDSYGLVAFNNEVKYQTITVYNGVLELGAYDGTSDLYGDGTNVSVEASIASLYHSTLTVDDGAYLYISTNNAGDAVKLTSSTITLNDGATLVFDDCADLSLDSSSSLNIAEGAKETTIEFTSQSSSELTLSDALEYLLEKASTINHSGEGSLTVNTSLHSSTTLNLTNGTINLGGFVEGILNITESADFNLIINSDNAGSTNVITGTVNIIDSDSADPYTIDIILGDIFEILGTSTTICSSDYTNIELYLDESAYTGASLSNNVLTVGDTVVITQEDGSATFTEDSYTGNTITVSGDYVLGSGESYSIDTIDNADGTLILYGGELSLNEDASLTIGGDNADLIAINGTLNATESGSSINVADDMESVNLTISGSLNIAEDITFSGSSLSLENATTSGSIDLVGSVLYLDNDSNISDSAVSLSVDSDGNISTIEFENGSYATSDEISAVLGDSSITIVADSSMLIGETYKISESTIDEDYFEFADGDFSYSVGSTNMTLTSSDVFQLMAESSNETSLAIAVDSIDSSGDDSTIAAKKAFKQAVEDNGLDYYLMNNYSQIAEVNSMLLSNMNVANVNRARSILEKSAGVQIEDEDGAISIENEDGTISVVDASEVSLIKYSNVAQLQSINLLGSKDASNGVAGYDYWSVGSTANFDKILSENALIGASIGGTYNKVEGDAGDKANSTTFLLNAYATYANEGLEVFANIGYSHFWNEGYKAGSGSADWDSDAFNALIGVSYDLETTIEGLTITPLAMLNMVYQNSDSASYSNGVDVNSESYFSAKLMLGFEFEYAINTQFNAIIRTMYTHECGDDTYDFSYGVGYVNGIEYVGSQAGKDAAVMGLGLSYDFSETCTAYFDYNAYAYSNLITHSLNLSVALKF